MYVGVVHTIRDAGAWAEMVRSVGPGSFPEGLELLATGTAGGSDRAICLWRAPSVERLRATLDEIAGPFAVDDCFAVSAAFTRVARRDREAAAV